MEPHILNLVVSEFEGSELWQIFEEIVLQRHKLVAVHVECLQLRYSIESPPQNGPTDGYMVRLNTRARSDTPAIQVVAW